LIKNELCVCDLATLIDISVSAISHQLRMLRNLKIVKFRKSGKMVYYSLDDEHVKNLITITREHVTEKS
jgi:ArsR family transcriptional regulator